MPEEGESIEGCANRSSRIEDDELAGFCHRYPPQEVVQLGISLPQSVTLDDWCGEFKSIPKEKAIA
jgi:hypothetical protein